MSRGCIKIKIRAVIPEFLKNKNVPPKLTEITLRELQKISTIKTASGKVIFNNPEKLEELEKLYEQAKQYLEANEHDDVWLIFQLLFKQDLELKERIAKALMPQSEEEIISEEVLTNLIEIQGFFSNFRIRLLEEITNRLIDLYDKSNSFYTSGDLEKGAYIANLAQNFYRYYSVKLKSNFEAPIDEYKGAMFQECSISLDVVKDSGERNLVEATTSVIKRENELKNN